VLELGDFSQQASWNGEGWVLQRIHTVTEFFKGFIKGRMLEGSAPENWTLKMAGRRRPTVFFIIKDWRFNPANKFTSLKRGQRRANANSACSAEGTNVEREGISRQGSRKRRRITRAKQRVPSLPKGGSKKPVAKPLRDEGNYLSRGEISLTSKAPGNWGGLHWNRQE